MTGNENRVDDSEKKVQHVLNTDLSRRAMFKRAGTLAALPVFAGALSERAAAQQGSISNDSVEAIVARDGNFRLLTASGQPLTFPSLGTSGLTVQVDGTNYVYGTPPGGRQLSEFLTQETTFSEDGSTATTVWELPEGIEVTQRLGLADEAIEFTLDVTNNSGSEHEVNLRYLHDYQVANQDGAPIFVQGSVRTTETRFVNPSFSSWQTYDQIPEPDLTGRGTQGTVPDQLDFVYWPDANGSTYEYSGFDPDKDFYTPGETSFPESDSAALLYFELGTLGPGDSDSATTYYGVGSPSQTSVRSVATALTSFKNSVTSLLSTTVESRAQAHAEIYSAAGDEYATNLVNYFGQEAGVSGISESDVDSSLLDDLDSLTEDLSQPRAEDLYNFFDEMFGAVSAEDPVDSIQSTFADYIRGTADQSNQLLVNGQTIQEIEDTFVSDFESRQANALDTLRGQNPPENTIQTITSFISNKNERVQTRAEQLEQNLAKLVEQVREGEDIRVVGGQVRPESDSAVGTQGFISGPIIGLGLLKGGSAVVSSISASHVLGTAGAGGLGLVGLNSIYGGSAAASSLGWTGYSSMYWTTMTTWANAGPSARNVVETMIADKALEEFGLSPEALIEDYTGIEIELITGLDDIAATLVEYLMDAPVQVADQIAGDLTITNVEAPGISSDDIENDVAEQTATVTVENNASEAITPTLINDRTTVQSTGIGGIRPFPDVGSYVELAEEMPSISPGETSDLTLNFGLPTENGPRFVGLYELTVGVASSSDRQNSDTATDTFGFVDLDLPAVNSRELLDSSVGAAESQRQTTSVTTDVDRATFNMSYGGSDLDLHLYDQDGNHIGRNYDTGEFEEEIPGGVPSGPDGPGESNEAIRVDDPDDSYDVEVVGLETDEGGTNFTTNAREVPELGPVMNVTPRRVSAVSRGGVIQRQFTVQEVADADSLTEVSFEAQDLTGENTGDVLPADSISFDRGDFGVESGSNETVTMSIDVPDSVSPDNYAGQVETNSAEDSVSISVSVSHAVVVDEPPRDLDTDGLFEDIDGSGSLDIFDVRALFNNLDDPAVQGNPQYFDFDEDGSDEVDIFDVRGLFNIFAAQGSSDTEVEDASELSDDEFTSLISE